MPRVSRKSFECCLFHVMVQGVNQEYIFNTEKEMKKYQTLMFSKLEDYKDIKLFAYCIMNNHAHMLIYSDSIADLSNYMKSVNTSFSMFYNKNKNRVGVVFRNRFESEPIINQKHLFNCLVYIHNNPVKAGIVKTASEYKYSSYQDYIDKKINDEIIKFIFDDLDDYLEVFENIHNKCVEQEFNEYKQVVDYDNLIKQILLHEDFEVMIKDETTFANVIKKLVVNNKIPIKNVCNYFKLSRYKVNKLIGN